MNYDAWLEEPYQSAAAEDDAFRDWCETFEEDPDDPAAHALWVLDLDAQRQEYEVETYLHNREIEDQEAAP